MKREKSLFELRRFWLAISFPLLFSASVAFYIAYTSDLNFLKGYEGLNSALDIFKVPLGILALVFPLVALAASSHRSEQSKKQIIISESQNSFANYYKHLEEFDKIVIKLKQSFGLGDFNNRYLYELLFPGNSPGYVITVSHGKEGELNSAILTIAKVLNEKVDNIDKYKNENETLMLNIESFFGLLASFSEMLYFTPTRHSECHLLDISNGAHPIIINKQDPFKHYEYFVRYMDFLGRFCHVKVSFKTMPNDRSLNYRAFEVLDKLKLKITQDPDTGEVLRQ